MISVANLKFIAEKGNPIKKFLKIKEQAEKAFEGSPPENLIINHTKSENPYKSLYKEE